MSNGLILLVAGLIHPATNPSGGSQPDPLVAGSHNTLPVTACTNYNPDKLSFTTLTKGGLPPYYYQWETASSGEGPWNDIPGSVDVLYDPPNLILPATYCFRCRITDQEGTIVFTRPKTIVIVPDPAVSVEGGGVMSQNSLKVLISTVTDGTGNITFQWFVSSTGTSGWMAIPGAIFSTYQVTASSVGIFYYKVRADASGAACSKPYSAVVPVIVIPDTSLPTFSVPPGPLLYCVENIGEAVYLPAVPGIDPYRPDYYLFSQGNQDLDLDPDLFRDDCFLTAGFSIRWEISQKGSVWSSGSGQPSVHESMQISGSSEGAVVHDITWWITDCNGNESLPESRNIIIRSRPQITIN